MGDRCGGTAAATAGLMIPLRLTSQPDDKRARRLAAGGFISGSSRISPARWWLGGLVQGCAFGNVASLQSGATRGAAHVLTLTFKGTLGANESPSRPRLCQNDGHHSREAGEKLVVVVEPKEDDGAKGVANQRPERRQQPYHLPSGLCRFTLSFGRTPPTTTTAASWKRPGKRINLPPLAPTAEWPSTWGDWRDLT